MKTLHYLFVITLLLSSSCYSQQYYDIKNPGNDYRKICQDCLNQLRNKPVEIQFGVEIDDVGNIYFIATDKEWYDKIIKSKGDGIAIDIVSKDFYDCSKSKIERIAPFKGHLLKPMYRKELKQNMMPSLHGEVIIKVGEVPVEFRNKEVEFNIVFLKNKYLCHIQSMIDLKSYRWDLLDMGFYFDTLTYRRSFDNSLSEQERYILQNKVLKFEIPFERNKSVYSTEDIKPLYDSLNLTDFNINTITIRAYSSVEGSEERNIQLQKERAESIVKALQSYQTPLIKTEIISSENWVDFLNDISSTSLSKLAVLNKDEIKEKLKDKETLAQLEPILQRHRKAVIILDLQKKSKYENIEPSVLARMFSQSISEKNLEQAVEIQNSIFEKVRNRETPVSLIDELEIPKLSEYSLLLNKNSIFKYLMNASDVFATYNELKELQDLLPKDAHIKYNICAIKFKVWLLGESAVNPTDFKKEINDLKKSGIPDNLVRRMLVNYEIIMCEYYMIKGDFANKDKSLKYIHSNYKYLPMSDSDYLSLAQYFSSYAKYDWATKLIEKEVKRIDVDEDLLFYYLNLTLIDEKLTKRSDYRTVMLNAYNINPHRFCEIFNAKGHGGVSFQLLDNEFLRETYCENCR